jgi:hypothetical protein
MKWTGLNWMKALTLKISAFCPHCIGRVFRMILTININRMDFAMKAKCVDWEAELNIFIFLRD